MERALHIDTSERLPLPTTWAICRQLLALGLPVAMNHASLALMQFFDAWLAGQMGDAALAAITPAGLLIAAWAVLGTETLSGVTTLAAQSIGQGRPQAAGRYTWQGLACAILFSSLLLLTYPLAGHLFRTAFPAHSPEMQELEILYYQISLFSLLPQMMSAALGNFFAAIRETKVILFTTVVAVIANAVLSYGFARGCWGLPRMGFGGLAWGTVWASTLQASLLLGLFLGRSRLRRAYATGAAGFSRKRSQRLLRIGFPSGLHSFVDFISWGILVTWLISFFGLAHVAAQTIMVRCITLSYLPAHGLSSALTAMVARAAGARNYLLARRQARAALFLNGAWMTAVAAGMVLFREEIIRIFTDDPEVIAVSKTAMLWVAGFQFFDAMNVTYADALQGAGDTFWPSAVNFTLSLTVLFGGGLAAVIFFPQFASSGVWAVATVYVAAHGILYCWRWNSRKWQHRKFLP